MAKQTKTQPNSGFSRRFFLAGAAGGAMLPVAASAAGPGNKKKRGIYADPANTAKADLEDKVADFSYQNDVLAQLIVDMWAGLHGELIMPAATSTTSPTKAQYQARSVAAKAVLAARGIYVEYPIVLTEEEYELGFSLLDAGLTVDGVVWVLPRSTRATTFGGPPLLETAKMLMAITPNGI
jgi:hypothetical protein